MEHKRVSAIKIAASKIAPVPPGPPSMQQHPFFFDVAFAHTPPKTSELALDIPPLTFDRVYNGHLTTSAFPLFKLPVELFCRILQYLTTKDFQALSTVDHECLRLAMPSNFKDVKLWFAPDKPQSLLASALTSSTSCHAPSHISMNMTSCIRRLTVTMDPTGRHLPSYSTVITDLENSDIHSFVRQVSNIIKTSLPNLHILDWTLPIALSPAALQSIFASPCRHLRLDGVIIHEDDAEPWDSEELALESLCLDVSFTAVSPTTPSHRFFDGILRRSRSTLRQLKWTGNFEAEEIYFTDDKVRFPALRSLTLDSIACNIDNVTGLLLGPDTHVETLAMDTMSHSASTFFAHRGYTPSMKHFCWLIHDQGEAAPYGNVMNFINANSQLETLHIPGPIAPSFMCQTLLPQLTQSFKSLTSLHLVWADSSISEEALDALSTIETLRDLWLSAGKQDSSRNTWEVDHDTILSRLSRLPHLANLAFSRDTYRLNLHPLAPRLYDYYSSRALPADLDICKYLSPADLDIYEGNTVDFEEAMVQQIAMRRLAWESWHAERMLGIGQRYRSAFPSLRWLFIGQLELRSSGAGEFELVNYPPRRDPALTALQKKMSLTLWRPV